MKSERGSIVLLVAFGTTLLLGIGALALDGAFMYDLRNRLGATADAAALSAAREIKRGNSANMAAFATREVNAAVTSGLIPSGVSVDAHLCTAAGATCTAPYNTAGFVEVILAKNQSTFLGKAVGVSSMTPGARAVAGTSASTSCMIVLDDMTVGHNATLNASGCAASVNDNLDVDSWTQLNVSAFSSGDCTGDCRSPITQNDPPVDDPFKDLAAPADPSPGTICGSTKYSASDGQTLSAGKYCGIDFGNHQTVHLANGLFYIDGDMTGKNGITIDNPAGGGVLIYIKSGDMDIKNSPVISLSGMNAATASAAGLSNLIGIVFFQARGNTSTLDFAKNGGDITLTGALYVPDGTIEYKNNGTVTMANGNDCSIVVAKNVNFKNNGTINNTCSGYGGSLLSTVAVSE